MHKWRLHAIIAMILILTALRVAAPIIFGPNGVYFWTAIVLVIVAMLVLYYQPFGTHREPVD